MKQYCRYCIHLAYGNGTLCGEKKTEMSESAIRKANNCREFEYCELDAIKSGRWQMDKQPQNTKSYVDKFDIMQRYGVGQEKAKSIMRAIKEERGNKN